VRATCVCTSYVSSATAITDRSEESLIKPMKTLPIAGRTRLKPHEQTV
jgi:hypothetical protein